jgi:hypothetical protein
MNPTVRWPDKTLPTSIHCAPGVLTTLELIASDGLLAMPRFGLGIGGLLLGRRAGERIEIRRTVEIPCAHSMGPSFVLNPEEIAKTLEMSTPEEGADEEVVGWYCSKTREPGLTEHDHVLMNAFCPEAWQVTMLIRPAKGKVTTAAFGLRAVDSDSFQLGEWMDLAWQELAEYQVAPPAEEPKPEPPPVPPAPIAMPRNSTLFGEPELELREVKQASPWPLRLLMVAILLAMLAAAGDFSRSYWLPSPTIALVASADWSGRVSVLWNSETLADQDQASLVIEDGSGPLHTIHLTQPGIRAGWAQYDARSGSITVTLLSGNLSDSVTLQVRAKSYLPESGISK